MNLAATSRTLCLIASAALFAGCESSPQANTYQQTVRAQEGLRGPSAIELSELREKSLELLNDAAFSKSALLRANAIEGLQSVPTRAENVIRMGLRDENVGVRYTAATSVGILRLTSSVEHVKPLLHDPDPRVRAAAIFAINQTGQQVNLNPLASILETRDSRLRSQVVWLIGEMNNSSAIPMLRDIANDKTWGTPTEDRLLRIQVAEALVKLGDTDAISSIRAALYPSSESEFELAVLAVQIIGEVKDRATSAQLVTLIQAEAEGSTPRKPIYLYPAELRLAAAASLAQMGFDDGTYVADAYLNAEGDAIRAQAAFVLAEIGHPANLPKLRTLLDDRSPLVQLYAAAAILKIIES